jgi:hypothetical protein
MERGNDRIVMGTAQDVRGKKSGVEGTLESWAVVSFRGIVRLEWFSDRSTGYGRDGLL